MVKRAIALLATVGVVLSTSLLGFAAGKVETIEKDVFVSDISYESGDSYKVGTVIGSIDEKFSAGEEINIYLDPSKFVGKDLKFDATTGMSVSDLKEAGVTIKISGGSNSNLIESASFKEKELNGKPVAMIQLKITPNVDGVEAKNFDTKMTLYTNKVKQQELVIKGEITAEKATVDSTDDYIYLGGGKIVEASENVNQIEVDAGNDVTLSAKLFKGKKYYAVADNSPKGDDTTLINENSDLETVIYLTTEGFIGSDVEVNIKSSEKLWVYDNNGKYLGTTDEKLALSSKYYLANVQTDSLDADAITQQPDDSGLDQPDDSDLDEPTAGDDSEIPNTGIGLLPKLAVGAVILGALGIIVTMVTSKKKK